jgi:hypothetical protein
MEEDFYCNMLLHDGMNGEAFWTGLTETFVLGIVTL